MDDNIFSHNLINASVQYSKNYIAKQRKAGASVNDLMQLYDPDVRHPAINLQVFAEKYLDEQTRNEWEKQCEQDRDKKYGTRFLAESLITSLLFDMLRDIARTHFRRVSLDVVKNDSHLWNHLDIKKNEKKNRFDLIFEVADYIYQSNLIASLEELDHYRECIWDAIYGWCEKHRDLIRDKYALEANDYPVSPLF